MCFAWSNDQSSRDTLSLFRELPYFGLNVNLAHVPRWSRYFTEYLSPNYNPSSFFFDPVTPEEIEREILLIPKNKTYGLYSCPIRILTDARCVISGPLSIIINISVQKGIFPSKLKKAKVVPVYKNDVETEPGNYRPISLLSIFNRIFEKLMLWHQRNYQCLVCLVPSRSITSNWSGF